MLLAVAGRFSIDLALAAGRELAEGEAGRYQSWGAAYCYGNRLETVRAVRDEFTFAGIADVKTDLALLCLNEPGAAEQPLVRREHSGTWAFCCQGPVPEPEKLTTGELMSDRSGPEEILFLHLIDKFDPDDPVGSVEACRPHGEEEPLFGLLSVDALVVSSGAMANRAGPGLWLGRGQLFRVVSQARLASVPVAEWEPIPDRVVMALTRLRRTLP